MYINENKYLPNIILSRKHDQDENLYHINFDLDINYRFKNHFNFFITDLRTKSLENQTDVAVFSQMNYDYKSRRMFMTCTIYNIVCYWK